VPNQSLTLFLDDGGVMNDNALRGPEWQRLAGVFFAPRLGGSHQAWARANHVVISQQWPEFERFFRESPGQDDRPFRQEMDDAWLAGMCREVGMASPATRLQRLQLADEANAYITRRVRSACPGAAEAIRQLHEAGYVLHTASGEHSYELDGYLDGMGVRHCFGTLYGSDLVGTAKSHPVYYQRILQELSLAPEQALFVDDKEAVLDWAADLGAQTVLCHPEPPRRSRHGHVVTLRDLPIWLEVGRDASSKR
jgi:HAD superfamily hydrolase (TIGR01509 family)